MDHTFHKLLAKTRNFRDTLHSISRHIMWETLFHSILPNTDQDYGCQTTWNFFKDILLFC